MAVVALVLARLVTLVERRAHLERAAANVGPAPAICRRPAGRRVAALGWVVDGIPAGHLAQIGRAHV